MFVGHYSVAFGVKSDQNRIPLWVLFVAVQFLDFIWAIFVLLGVEKLRIIPGFTAGSPLDAYFMPYSHSLIAALVWSGIAAAIYKVGWRAKASHWAAFLVGLAVLSHWLLDFIVHPPDLPIYDDTWKMGLGLLNYREAEFGLEVAILVAGVILYLRRNTLSEARRWGVVGFGIMLVVIQVGDTFVPRSPLTDQMTAMGVLIFCSFVAGLAFLLDPSRAAPSEPGRT